MFGIDMILDSLGLEPEKIQANVAEVVAAAQYMKASQDRIEIQNAKIIARLDAILSYAPKPVTASEPIAETPSQEIVNG